MYLLPVISILFLYINIFMLYIFALLGTMKKENKSMNDDKWGKSIVNIQHYRRWNGMHKAQSMDYRMYKRKLLLIELFTFCFSFTLCFLLSSLFSFLFAHPARQFLCYVIIYYNAKCRLTTLKTTMMMLITMKINNNYYVAENKNNIKMKSCYGCM